MSAIERSPQDYVDRRIIEAERNGREYTDSVARDMRHSLADFGYKLRVEWQADIRASEERMRIDTAAILTAVRERPQIPGWLAGLTPGRAAAIVGVLGGATSSLVALVAALVPLIAAVRGVYLPVAPVAAPTVQMVPDAPEDAP